MVSKKRGKKGKKELTRRDFLKRTSAATAAIAGSMVFGIPIVKAKEDPVKIAVLTDQSAGYASLVKRDVDAVQMAIEDVGGKVLGSPILFTDRDHKNKPGIAAQKAKELYEKERVDAIFDVAQSACALAVSEQAKIHRKFFFSVSSGTTKHTREACNPYTFDWAYNDYMLATSAGLWAAEHLGKKWFTITADYAWGHDLFEHFTAALRKKGGTLVGNEMVALGTSDFSPYLINAMNSGAEVLVLLNGGRDTNNSAKQAGEFGVKKKMKIVHCFLLAQQVAAVGAKVFGGNYGTVPWYWKSDNPGAKEFADEWMAKFDGRPNWMNAGTYSAALQYLKAVKRAGTKKPGAVIEKLEGHTYRDLFNNPGYVRPEDHMAIADAHIIRAKREEEKAEKWDVFEFVGTVPAEEAYGPPSALCKMKKV